MHLEWMLKKAEEVRQLVGWLGRVNGVMEVERGRAIWELMGLPAVCYGDEVRWAGSKVMQGKLEATQVQVGRKLLGASRTVASCAVRGELGWRTLKERREERMLRFVAKVQRMEDSRLTKKVCRAEGLVWWKEVEGVLVKYGLGVGELDGCWLGIRKQLRMFCERRWREVCGKRSLDLFSEVKRKLVLEDYLKCVRGRRGVSAWFGFRSRSVGLRAEVSGWSNRNVAGTCVLCCMDEEEDVEHVLLRCGAYAEERRKLWSVLEEDCVGWEEMAEGEKLVVLLGGGGARVSSFLRGILERRRRWTGVGGFRGF